jgi:ribonuclease D
VLHAADQDLPCLAEIGMTPPRLYDTELGGRLAGFDRVNLAAMVQRLLGLHLVKGHGAADWSKRPLPAEWLNYAALDVEVLLELRAAVAAVLEEQGKTDWAAQEFEYLRTLAPTPTRRDRWRKTSGIHKVRNPRTLAAVRELWTTRDGIAQRRDIAPGRILPDAAIVNAATADPDTVEKLTALAASSGAARRSGSTPSPGPASPRTCRRRRSRRPDRRPPRGGRAASPRPPPDWRPRGRVSPNCRNGFRCRRRTCSPPTRCAGCAGTGNRCPTSPPGSRSSSPRPGLGRGSGN